MKRIFYDLGGLIVGADLFAATRLEFAGLMGIGTGPIERDRSFNAALGLIIDELRLTRLDFAGTDVTTLAWDLDLLVGMSIIRVDDATASDRLTWIRPMVRHCDLATLMKAHALGQAVAAEGVRFRTNGASGTIPSLGALGVVPA